MGAEDSEALACGTGAVWCSTCGIDFLAMRMPLLCKEAWDGWTPLMKWWDRSVHKSRRVHSTSHPIRSDLRWPSPNWFLSYGVALLKCGLRFSISGRSVVSANNLDREVKGHGNFAYRPGSFGRIFNTWEGVFVRYDIDDLWCIHHHLDVARQLHQNMAILDEYLVSSKVRMSNTPKFPSLSSPSLILEGFWFWDQDAKMMPSTMLRGSSAGPCRSVVNANNLDREVKGHRKFEHRPGSFGRVFNTSERACEIWYRLIMMNRWSIMYPLSPWRGETALSEMAIFDEYPVSSKVRMCNTPKFPSLSSPSLILKGFWFWDQDARILPCTIFRGPSAGPGRSVVSANNLDREVKGHRPIKHLWT